MRRLLAVAVLVVGVTTATPAAASPPAAGAPLYMALGDSLGVGIGAPRPIATNGYVGLVHAGLRDGLDCAGAGTGCPQLGLMNLGVSGATTTSLIERQLPLALAVLQQRNTNDDPADDVRVITVDIGGNDLFRVVETCLDGEPSACAADAVDRLLTVSRNLSRILGALRVTAGPDTHIAVMTYYNPLPGCVLAGLAPLGELVLEGPPGGLSLNGLIRAIAARYGATVADVHGRIGPAELVGFIDCLHTNGAGHAVLAEAFLTALGAPS